MSNKNSKATTTVIDCCLLFAILFMEIAAILTLVFRTLHLDTNRDLICIQQFSLLNMDKRPNESCLSTHYFNFSDRSTTAQSTEF